MAFCSALVPQSHLAHIFSTHLHAYTHTHTHTQGISMFFHGFSIDIMFFILYKLYITSPYSNTFSIFTLFTKFPHKNFWYCHLFHPHNIGFTRTHTHTQRTRGANF